MASANQNITVVRDADTPIIIQVDDIDLSGKSVTGSIKDPSDSSSVTIILGGTTVTQTGNPSIFSWVPDSTVQSLARGMYTIQWTFTDGSGNKDQTNPNNKLFIQ